MGGFTIFDPKLDIAIWILILVLSSSFHELAHAWVAWKCGDDTAKNMGRISFNPLVHICPYNSVLIPAILYFTMGFFFGGAKPVPINPLRMRKPDRDMALSSAAGPISNFLLVLFCMVLLILYKHIFKPISIKVAYQESAFIRILFCAILLNLFLAFFNLIPIPPLDGSRIARYLFPFLKDTFDALDLVGLFLLILIFSVFPNSLNFIWYLILLSWQAIAFIYKLI